VTEEKADENKFFKHVDLKNRKVHRPRASPYDGETLLNFTHPDLNAVLSAEFVAGPWKGDLG
jgi:hypothetical protein